MKKTSRIDIIGQNGNDGEHYNQTDFKNVDVPNKNYMLKRLHDQLTMQIISYQYTQGDPSLLVVEAEMIDKYRIDYDFRYRVDKLVASIMQTIQHEIKRADT